MARYAGSDPFHVKPHLRRAIDVLERLVGNELLAGSGCFPVVPEIATRLIRYWRSPDARLSDALALELAVDRREPLLVVCSTLSAVDRALVLLSRRGGFPLDAVLDGGRARPPYPRLLAASAALAAAPLFFCEVPAHPAADLGQAVRRLADCNGLRFVMVDRQGPGAEAGEGSSSTGLPHAHLAGGANAVPGVRFLWMSGSGVR
jgi:hypothetical protein